MWLEFHFFLGFSLKILITYVSRYSRREVNLWPRVFHTFSLDASFAPTSSPPSKLRPLKSRQASDDRAPLPTLLSWAPLPPALR